MSLRRSLAVLVGAVLTLATLTAPPAAAVDTIQLSGTVTNSDGVPQNGSACIELVGGGSCSGTFIVNGVWSITWTDGANAPGDYLVRISSSTMNGTTRWYLAGNLAGTTDKTLATPVHLDAGEPDLAFDMVMPAIAKVTGRVVNTSGDGVAGLNVGMNQLGQGRSTTTDATGHYDFGYTRAGTWPISVAGNATYAGTQGSVVVPSSGAVVVADLTVQQSATISGAVTDSISDDPIPFINVEAYSATEPRTYLGSDETDVLGRYVIGGLGNTPLVLRFTDEVGDGYVRTLNDGGDPVDWNPQTPITLGEGEERVYDQALVPQAPATPATHNLAGTVTDEDARPLAGIFVSFGDAGDVTDRLGHWYLDASDGTHLLEFTPDSHWAPAYLGEPTWAPESFPGRLVSATPTPVTVTGGVGADDLDITLVRSVTSSGAPVVTGTAATGQTLTASQGTWLAPTGTTFATAWLRDGVVVSTGPTRVLTAADAGRSVVARVTATFGLAVTAASSAARVVDRLATTTTATGRSTKAHRVKVKIRVSSPGLTPSGTVTVLRGRKVVTSGVALVNGRAKVLLKRQPSGRARYRVTFAGAAQTLPSSSSRFKVEVL